MRYWYLCELVMPQRRKDPTKLIGVNILRQLTLFCNFRKVQKDAECHRDPKVFFRREMSEDKELFIMARTTIFCCI